MKDVEGKVAFITGGANGIGLGMARVFTDAGMKVVIADIRQGDLDRAMESLADRHEALHAVTLDITDRAAMAAAAAETVRVFGKVHVVCNNAGINVFGPMDEATYDDWDWVMNVNLNGVINGVVTFIPYLKSHGEGGHIVNTGSMASFISGPGAGIYTAAKFGVRGISESLWYALAPQGIGVSVLCPGLVKSHIHASESIRPEKYSHSGYPENEEFRKRLEEVHQIGMEPEEVARKVLRGIRNDDLYIFSHPDHREELRRIFADIMAYFPDEEPEPRRMAFEDMRRKAAADIREQVRLRNAPGS